MPNPGDDAIRIPLVEESFSVGRTQVVSDRVRVTTAVETREVVADEMLERGTVVVERRAAERAVETAPPPRQEGDTLIVSVVEERLVTSRQLFVVEELLIRQQTVQERVSVPVTLRRTRATVERDPEFDTGSVTKGE